MFFGEAFFEEKGDIEKSIIIQKREDKKQKKKWGSEQDCFNDQSNHIEQGVRVLRVGIFLTTFLQILVYLGIIVFFIRFTCL